MDSIISNVNSPDFEIQRTQRASIPDAVDADSFLKIGGIMVTCYLKYVIDPYKILNIQDILGELR